MDLSVYIHIPFCVNKCFYCDFLSFRYNDFDVDEYVNALIKEIRSFDLKKYNIKTLFIGGGTPTILKANLIEKILKNFDLSENVEITIEANPDTLNKDVLKDLKSTGINRLSIGLQAWQNRLLKLIGRPHTNQDFLTNYENAIGVGFSNINVDIMFGLPTQTIQDFSTTINQVTKLNPSHISAYSLILEEGTKLFDLYEEIDEDLDRIMYDHAISTLKEKGYNRYEISNFSKERFECKHNIVYWQRGEYIGFGLGSHSFMNGVRYNNTKTYMEYINNPVGVKENIEQVLPKDAMSEFIFLGLRMTRGISVQQFQQLFGCSIFDIYGDKIIYFKENGFLKCDNKQITLTEKGFSVSNIIFSEFL